MDLLRPMHAKGERQLDVAGSAGAGNEDHRVSLNTIIGAGFSAGEPIQHLFKPGYHLRGPVKRHMNGGASDVNCEPSVLLETTKVPVSARTKSTPENPT